MREQRSDEDIIECYAEVLANITEMLNQDIMVLITNRTHRLHYYPGKKLAVDMSRLGDVLSEDDQKVKAMREGRIRSYVVDQKIFGFPFLSVDYPLRNARGEIIGCIGFGRSLEREYQIEGISQGLAATLEQANASLEEVAAGSQGLSRIISNVVRSANESAGRIAEIGNVITAISDIANHSNLLGLNAAIEAARAGEHGRGFAVVADEMRKLAAQSKASAGMVTETLNRMRESMEGIIGEINQVGDIAENQAAATEEITAAIQEVSDNSQNLAQFARIE